MSSSEVLLLAFLIGVDYGVAFAYGYAGCRRVWRA